MQGGQDGDGQSCALCGVCSGAQLIEEHQGILIRLLNKMHYIGHMGGEGTEALLNALLIPDICVYLLEDAEAGIVKGRYVKT